MSTDPIPQASVAPPLPASDKNPLAKYMPAAIAGVVLFGCLAFSCGSVVTWGMMRTPGGGVGVANGKPGDKAPHGKSAPPVTKPSEQWGYQDLQDHLASKGMKTSRGLARQGMWFCPGDGTPLSAIDRSLLDDSDPYYFRPNLPASQQAFVANILSSPDAAKASAAGIKDVAQRDSFAWNCFVFNGHAKVLDHVKSLLP